MPDARKVAALEKESAKKPDTAQVEGRMNCPRQEHIKKGYIRTAVFVLAVGVVLMGCGSVPALAPAPTAFATAALPASSNWQKQVDAILTEETNDRNAAPEMRINAVASQAEFDSLCRVDARLGTREAHIYFDQEVARQQRILDAMQRFSAPAASLERSR